jgi:hypothetical protein
MSLSFDLLCFFFLFAAALLLYRWKRTSGQKAFLLTPIPAGSEMKQRIAATVGLGETIPIALSTFDVLYNMSKIDPHCLLGVKHLHHSQNFANLGDLMRFLQGSIMPSNLDGSAWRSMIHKYKGYTGEESAFDHLQSSGHHVERAISPTQQGYDAVIDGDRYNVKITDDPTYISDHLRHHPDIDVLTNSEMATAFAGNPHVHIDSALSAQQAFHSTAETFDGVHDIGGLFHHIPVITLLLSGARNARSVAAKRKTLVDAAEHTAVDTVTKGLGGFGGAKLGLLIGLALAPVTGGLSAVAATAGCTLLGSVGGVFAGKSIGSWFKARHLRKLQALLNQEAPTLRDAFVSRVSEIIKPLDRSCRIQLESYRNARRRLQNWLQRIFVPSTMTTFYSLASKQSKHAFREWQAFFAAIRDNALAQPSPLEGGLCIYSYGRDVYAASPTITSAWDLVHERLALIETERLRIS